MALYKEIAGLSTDDLLDHWFGHEPVEAGTDDGYLDEDALELRQRGPEGIAFLRSQLDQSDPVRVTAAILGLTSPPLENPDIAGELLGLLSDRRPSVVAWAIRGLRYLGRTDALPVVLPLLHHQSPYVRCAALGFMRRQAPERSKDVLLPALSDDDHLVRMCAADELDELADPDVLPYLRPLLADPHPDVREAAETAIENLAMPAGAAD